MYSSDFKSQELGKLYENFIYLLIIIGLGLRLFHFFYNRSLWMDEIYLSTSLIKLNYKELITGPLYYQQKAPILFLLATKAIVNLFGSKEIYLRIVPLLSSVVAIFLFVPVAKHFLKGYAACLAIGIVCLSPALVYHSVEIKQYSTEFLATILSIYLLIKFKGKTDIRSLVFWGFSGALILWFSYSAIFILGGIGIGLSINNLWQKKWGIVFKNLIPFTLWFLSFTINYLLFTHKHAESEWIAYWFRSYGNFMPLPPKSISDLKWFAINIYRMLDYPLGLLWNFNNYGNSQALNMLLKMPFLPIIFIVIGFYAIVKNTVTEFLTLIIPILLMFLASGLELYPLTERFWVFISPIFILILGKGFETTTYRFRQNWALLILVLMFIGPTVQSAESLIKPNKFFVHKKSFQREALSYLNENFKEGDAVYVYWNNLPGYRLYKDMYKYRYIAIEGSDQRKNALNYNDYYKNLKKDFGKFSNNKRVWIVINSQFLTDIGDKIDEPKWYYDKKMSPEEHLLTELLKNYILVEKHKTKDVDVYLLEPLVKS